MKINIYTNSRINEIVQTQLKMNEKKNERINCSFKRIKKTEITTTTTMKGKKIV